MDLAWTVRFRNVWPTETLVDSSALLDWLQGAYPDAELDDALDAGELLEQIRILREAVYALLMATIRDTAWQPSDRRVVNEAAQGPRFVHQLGPTDPLPAQASSVEQVLAELAIDAIDVLKSDRARLKSCEGPLCALPFLDDSRGATRRWCTTQRCGNRVNTRAYRERSRRRDSTSS